MGKGITIITVPIQLCTYFARAFGALAIMTTSAPTATPQPSADAVKAENDGPDHTSEQRDSSEPAPRMKKRRLLGVDPSLIISEERSKRRKTPTPEAEADEKDVVRDPKDPERAKQLGLQIYGKVMESRDPE